MKLSFWAAGLLTVASANGLLVADSYGNASVSFTLKGVSLASGAHDLVGKGLIVHRDADDYTTQPTGNAGPRIACAVIKKT